MAAQSKLNNYFSYYTNKMVIIRDWKLGMLYYSFLIAIFAWILYNLFDQKTYLDKVPPQAGSVRASVQFDEGFRQGSEVPPYCAPSDFSLGCVFWTPEQIVYPYSGDLNSLFITTRVTFSQTPAPTSSGCTDFLTGALNASCIAPSQPSIRESRSYYVANVEKLNITVDHSVRAQYTQPFGVAKFSLYNATNMEGKLLQGCSGEERVFSRNFDKTYRDARNASRRSPLDNFQVGELLNSSDCSGGSSLSLGAKSESSSARTNEPLRSTGFVISLPIWYTNHKTVGDESSIKYRYIPAAITQSDFKIVEQRTNADGSITYIERSGIQIVFSQAGSIGSFNFLNLVLNLVAGLGLLTIGTRIVEILMLYILPKKKIYNAVKYEETIDLDDHPAPKQDGRSSTNTYPGNAGTESQPAPAQDAYYAETYYAPATSVSGSHQTVVFSH